MATVFYDEIINDKFQTSLISILDINSRFLKEPKALKTILLNL